MSGSILFAAIVFLTGAIICVPIAKKLGLSSVLGYLMAGILIGHIFWALWAMKVRTYFTSPNLVL